MSVTINEPDWAGLSLTLRCRTQLQRRFLSFPPSAVRHQRPTHNHIRRQIGELDLKRDAITS